MDSDATVLEKSSETTSGDAARMMVERSTESESVKTAETVSPTESEIATVAYQLWLDDGCPVGSDQEYWFRAEAMLKRVEAAVKNALAAKCEDASRLAESASEVFQGHWEVWEREWVSARWVWDLGHSRR